jgi:hypothetical protein
MPLLIGGGIFALLLVVGIAYLVFFRGGSKKTEVAKEDDKSSTPTPAPKKKGIDVAYASDSFTAAVVLHPKRTLKAKMVEPLPLKKYLEQAQQIGIDPSKIEEAVIYLEPLINVAKPTALPGGVFRLTEDFKAKDVLSKVTPMIREATYNEKKYLVAPNLVPGAPVAVYQPDDRTVVIGFEMTVQKMLDAKPDKGPLVDRLRKIDLDNDLTLVFTVSRIRTFLDGMAKNVSQSVPPGFEDVGLLAQNLEAITLTLDFEGDTLAVVDLEAKDDKAAESVAKLADLGVDTLKKSYDGFREDIEKGTPPEIAQDLMPVLDDLVKSIKWNRDGTHIVVEMKTTKGLPGLLKKILMMAEKKEQSMKVEPIGEPDGSSVPSGGQVLALKVDKIAGPDATTATLDWVRDHNQFGPDHAIVKDVRTRLVNVRDGEGYILSLGSDLVKSKKATLLARWGDGVFVFELTPEQAMQLRIQKKGLDVVSLPKGEFPAGEDFLLSGPKIDNASSLDITKKITGSVAYRELMKSDRTPSVRMVIIAGGQVNQTFSHPKGPPDKKRLPISIEPLPFQYSGPAVAFIDAVTYLDESRFGDGFPSSKPVAMLLQFK